jgi:hypothetical protein
MAFDWIKENFLARENDFIENSRFCAMDLLEHFSV